MSSSLSLLQIDPYSEWEKYISVVCLFVCFARASQSKPVGMVHLQNDICSHFLILPDNVQSVFINVVFHHVVHQYSLHSTD